MKKQKAKLTKSKKAVTAKKISLNSVKYKMGKLKKIKILQVYAHAFLGGGYSA